MTRMAFETTIVLLGSAFAVFFFVTVLPPALASGDIAGAFAAGFVNPFAAGYSTDVIICAMILLAWAAYERSHLGIRHGWVVVPLSFMPGVAVAFAVYLLIRSRQLSRAASENASNA